HSAASVCAMVRAGVGVSIVNPLTALDYAATGIVVRRFSVAVPFTVSLIRPLHRPASARQADVVLPSEILRRQLRFIGQRMACGQYANLI
ncbi:hypothetical protein DCJ57_25880, partial [Salmonella enterica subsp. enterica serovar 4,12:i:-]|nr:hypothetical protein [Salmonella enterica subsp. enterica serovar 4,12:i:-]